jgi:hypothetical protein
LVLAACSSNQQLTSEQQQDRVVKMLDERKYSEAIGFIEEQVPTGEQARFQPYLAEAYLGRAGFVPLELAARIIDTQSTTDQPDIQGMIPGCTPEPLTGGKTTAARCYLWRLFLNLPDYDQPDFEHARNILRTRFADVKEAGGAYNTLCGLVEVSSTLTSLKKLLLKFSSLDLKTVSDEEAKAVLAELVVTSRFALESLKRARAIPYFDISKQFTGAPDTIFKRRKIDIDYIEETGIPLIIRLASSTDTSATVEAWKEKLIDKLASLKRSLKQD